MKTFSEIVEFHGHRCPGLAIGYRMALAAMDELESSRAADDEIVAIVENDACGVDALQCVTGCTFGKGNLLFRDYGKQVYTLYSRATLKGVRVVFHRDKLPSSLNEDRSALVDYILSAPAVGIMSLTSVPVDAPVPARTRISLNCARCNEAVMETRLIEVDGLPTCIPCAEGNVPLE